MTELDENSGPGAAFQVFLQNEALMEKLKLLSFERDFLQKQKGLRTISRITFSMPNKESHGEQFTQFIKLAQFLLQDGALIMKFHIECWKILLVFPRFQNLCHILKHLIV